MIRAQVSRSLIVEDSADEDESMFTVYQRDESDVQDDVDGGHPARRLMMPHSVYLTLDDAEDFARALLLMCSSIREELPVEAPDVDELCRDPHEGLTCSLPVDHDGAHRAYPNDDVDGTLLEVWERP